LIQSKST